jgi:DNA invertase Pin-like site-specific DNA recombinase
MPKPFSKEKIAQIISDHQNEMSKKEISEKHSVNQNYLYELLNNNNARKPLYEQPKKIDHELLANEYASGLTAEKVANKFDVSDRLVLKAAKENDVPIRNKNLNLTDDQIKEMIADYVGRNMSSYAIGRKFHISPTQIRKILAKNNIQTHPPKITDEQKAEIISMHKSGVSGKIIAETFKINDSTVSKIIKRA